MPEVEAHITGTVWKIEVEVGDDMHVNLTGWARPVYAGELSEDFVKELNETK